MICSCSTWGLFSNFRSLPAPQAYLHKRLEVPDLFAEIQKKDLLFHHPYDSFGGYFNFIQNACSDPKVTSIQQTVYRVDPQSKVIDLLKSVARKKQIRVL